MDNNTFIFMYDSSIKKLCKGFFGLFPGSLVDAVFNPRWHYIPLDESRFLQFFEVLGNSRLRHWNFLGQVARKTAGIFIQ